MWVRIWRCKCSSRAKRRWQCLCYGQQAHQWGSDEEMMLTGKGASWSSLKLKSCASWPSRPSRGTTTMQTKGSALQLALRARNAGAGSVRMVWGELSAEEELELGKTRGWRWRWRWRRAARCGAASKITFPSQPGILAPWQTEGPACSWQDHVSGNISYSSSVDNKPYFSLGRSGAVQIASRRATISPT